jgi:cell division septum initiation protein DivIVA
MDIQQTVGSLKEEIETLQNKINELEHQARYNNNSLVKAGTLYSVQTANGGYEKSFSTLDDAVEYYSALKQRLLGKKRAGSRSTVEIELYKTKTYFKQNDWEQF